MTDNREMIKVKEKEQQWEEVLETEAVVAPFVDIYETEDNFVLTANMLGVARDDVKLKLEEGSLSIFGKVNYDELQNDGGK